MTYPDTSGLPVNLDTANADSGTDATVKAHQQHHDTVHAAVKAVPVDFAAKVLTTTIQIAAAYTLVIGDAGTLVERDNAAANSLTVPPNSSVAFPVGAVIGLRQYGAGQTTVTPGAGVTIRSRGAALKLHSQYAEATLTKRATDEWVLSGDVVA